MSERAFSRISSDDPACPCDLTHDLACVRAGVGPTPSTQQVIEAGLTSLPAEAKAKA